MERRTDNTADFRLITRGAWKNLVVELSDIQDDATITIDLRAATERPSTPATFRKPGRLSAQRIQFPLADLKSGSE